MYLPTYASRSIHRIVAKKLSIPTTYILLHGTHKTVKEASIFRRTLKIETMLRLMENPSLIPLHDRLVTG